MLLDTVSPDEAFAAYFAGKRRLSCVQAHVVRVVDPAIEGLRTHGALELVFHFVRRLPMNLLVYLLIMGAQPFFFHELFAKTVILVLFIVCLGNKEVLSGSNALREC